MEKEEEEVVSNQIGVPICLHNVSQSEIKACREPGAFGSLLPRLIHTSMVVIPFVQHFFKGQCTEYIFPLAVESVESSQVESSLLASPQTFFFPLPFAQKPSDYAR